MRLAALVLLALVACKGPQDEPAPDPVFLQAVGGAVLANPDVHPQIPVRIAAPEALAVTVSGPGGEAEAFADDEGTWVAWVTTGAESGELSVTASWSEEETTEASIDLVLSTEGVQLTVLSDVGGTTTPTLLWQGTALWGSYCDRREELAQCWAQPLDGAGRWQGDAIRLSDAAEDTLYARTAAGGDHFGVLYQLPDGAPYLTGFRIVGTDGSEVLVGQSVHETDWQGTFGGDVAWDGEAYAMAWRERDANTGDSGCAGSGCSPTAPWSGR